MLRGSAWAHSLDAATMVRGYMHIALEIWKLGSQNLIVISQRCYLSCEQELILSARGSLGLRTECVRPGYAILDC